MNSLRTFLYLDELKVIRLIDETERTIKKSHKGLLVLDSFSIYNYPADDYLEVIFIFVCTCHKECLINKQAMSGQEVDAYF